MAASMRLLPLVLVCFAAGCQSGPATEDDVQPRDDRMAVAAPAGFQTEMDDGRMWVLTDGQEKSDKHVTLIGAGPGGVTLKAVDRDTALAFLAARPGFETSTEDGRVWVLREGQEKSEKHVTAVGVGPLGSTVRALDRDTLLAWRATRPGFTVEIEEGRVWVLRPGQERSDKHVTRIGIGPGGATVKACDAETLDAWIAAGS